MKNKMITLTLSLLILATTATFAQESPDARIKVLPSRPGYAKVLYAMEKTEPVTVRFIRDGQVLMTDVVKDGPFEKGFLKWYDLRRIGKDDCQVEISDSRSTVTYRIVPYKNTSLYYARLESVRYNEAYVAAK